MDVPRERGFHHRHSERQTPWRRRLVGRRVRASAARRNRRCCARAESTRAMSHPAEDRTARRTWSETSERRIPPCRGAPDRRHPQSHLPATVRQGRRRCNGRGLRLSRRLARSRHCPRTACAEPVGTPARRARPSRVVLQMLATRVRARAIRGAANIAHPRRRRARSTMLLGSVQAAVVHDGTTRGEIVPYGRAAFGRGRSPT